MNSLCPLSAVAPRETVSFSGTGLEQRGICCSAFGDPGRGAIRLKDCEQTVRKAIAGVPEYQQLGLAVRREEAPFALLSQ